MSAVTVVSAECTHRNGQLTKQRRLPKRLGSRTRPFRLLSPQDSTAPKRKPVRAKSESRPDERHRQFQNSNLARVLGPFSGDPIQVESKKLFAYVVLKTPQQKVGVQGQSVLHLSLTA